MEKFSFQDPMFNFSSHVEIGSFLVTVSIDGLPPASFTALGMKNFIHNSAKSSAVLLELHNCEEWKISLDPEQTIARIVEVLTVRRYQQFAEIVKRHSKPAAASDNLEDYWSKSIIPEIMEYARKNGVEMNNDYDVTMAWCNPFIAGRRLHPRALRFIEKHWPAVIEDYKKNRGVFVKSA